MNLILHSMLVERDRIGSGHDKKFRNVRKSENESNEFRKCAYKFYTNERFRLLAERTEFNVRNASFKNK